MEHIYNIFRGMAIGIANVIPGVSGGTMAVILGIYERLTEAVGNFVIDKKNRLRNIILLVTIGIGAVIGVILFARFFSFLLTTELTEQATYLFFVGLIIGSIPFIIKLHSDMKINGTRLFLAIIAIGLILLTTFFEGSGDVTSNLEVKDTWLGFMKITDIDLLYGFWLSVCGLLGAGSMVLPGFSGSALLISLGEYNNVLFFVDQRMIVPVGFLVLGVIPGIIIFAKVISIFLKKFPSETYYFIIGLLIASNYQIYTEIKDILDYSFFAIILSIFTFVAGFALAYFSSKINN